jgi:hypothetical protein
VLCVLVRPSPSCSLQIRWTSRDDGLIGDPFQRSPPWAGGPAGEARRRGPRLGSAFAWPGPAGLQGILPGPCAG